jgi:DnaJ-class molecular chaperone
MDGAEAKSEWDRPTSRFGKREQMLRVMGLEPDSTPEELKARYKELVKKHHPDVNHGDKAAEERLKLINEAYTYLRGSDRIV